MHRVETSGDVITSAEASGDYFQACIPTLSWRSRDLHGIGSGSPESGLITFVVEVHWIYFYSTESLHDCTSMRHFLCHYLFTCETLFTFVGFCVSEFYIFYSHMKKLFFWGKNFSMII